MSVFQPIVYTRPFRHNVMDYCYFVFPEALRAAAELSKVIDRHIKNVQAEEGGRGSIRGRRWHVFRCGEYILLGFATESFGRRDETGVPIRGYYGVLMTVDNACVPPLSFFSEIDAQYVEPHFNDYKNFERVYGTDLRMSQENAQIAEGEENREDEVEFNFEEDKLMFLSNAVAEERYLRAAVNAAKHSRNFEFVFGFNSEGHARELPVMNAVCYGVGAKLVALHEQEVHSIGRQTRPEAQSSFASRQGTCKFGERISHAEAHDKENGNTVKMRSFGIEYAEEDEGFLTATIQHIIRSLVWIDAHIDRRGGGAEKFRIYDGEGGHYGPDRGRAASPQRASGKTAPNYAFGMSVERS